MHNINWNHPLYRLNANLYNPFENHPIRFV
jgi:hypothetical protein